ncbi:hypothetical protein OI25_4199 [Paraburkholderia fungorum]|uniref:Cysteine rich repeat-containing protein n=1 Tax=Paraburkholderia fungorum TaxID=134537 RepID=A0AAU8TA69_9BURK|nr:hypothetical protein [Paraburkholderia fungorum]AJZ63283.1 hypothetical protein OI25_4199 [Paraburkholderia fungorum]
MKQTFALLAASLAVFSAVNAASAATEDEQAKACRGDAMHFCAAEIPNKEKITACMKQHVDELSPACRAMFKGGKKDGAKANPASQ